jgi:hypothetical protein
MIAREGYRVPPRPASTSELTRRVAVLNGMDNPHKRIILSDLSLNSAHRKTSLAANLEHSLVLRRCDAATAQHRRLQRHALVIRTKPMTPPVEPHFEIASSLRSSQ